MVSLELLTCKVYQSSLNLLTKQLVTNMAGLTMWGLAQITFLNPPILSFISHDHFLSIVLSSTVEVLSFPEGEGCSGRLYRHQCVKPLSDITISSQLEGLAAG